MVRAARKNSRRPPFPRTVAGIAEFFRRAQLGIPFFMRGFGKAKSGGRAQSAALPEQGSKAPRFAAAPRDWRACGGLGRVCIGFARCQMRRKRRFCLWGVRLPLGLRFEKALRLL